jgi:hypothetical protein
LLKHGFQRRLLFGGMLGVAPWSLDQRADAVGVVGLVGQHDGAWAEVIQQAICDLAVVCLSCGQTEPDREPLRVDDDVDFGSEPA